MRKIVWLFFVCLPVVALPQSRIFTADDYARAEKFLAPNLAPLVVGGSVSVKWLEGDRFWYRRTTDSGVAYYIIDPAKRTRVPYTPTAKDTAAPERPRGRRGFMNTAVLSPDGKQEAFIRDWNLWVRDVATKQEKQLTSDGA